VPAQILEGAQKVDIVITEKRKDFLNAGGNGLFSETVKELFARGFERLSLMALLSGETRLTLNDPFGMAV
jgi:hypothetical protein